MLGFFADTLAKLGFRVSRTDTGSGWRAFGPGSPDDPDQTINFMDVRHFFTADSLVHCSVALISSEYADTSGSQDLSLRCEPYLGKNTDACSVLRASE